jgi:hypothetical protein
MGCYMHSCDEVLEGDELPSLEPQLNGAREPGRLPAPDPDVVMDACG